MKTKIALLWLLASLYLLSGCKGIFSRSNQTGNVRYALLSSYPEDVMPLYENQRVLYCAFELKEQPNPIYGRGIYIVRFSSNAKKSDALQFYKSRFTRMDDSNATDFISGNVGMNPVSISVIDNAGSSDITITVGLTNAQLPSTNPYFRTYPDTVKALGDNTLSARMFERYDQATRSDRYTVTYTTSLSEAQFSSLYEKAYRGSPAFSISVYESTRTYSFRDGKATWSISYETKTSLVLLRYLIEAE